MIDSKQLIKSTGHTPNKALGQNFLTDTGAIDKIIQSIDCSGLNVLEIGPGFGALTNELAKYAKKVVAVEIDRNLADFLSDLFRDRENIEIICCDFLKLPLPEIESHFFGQPFVVAANLPYYITSPIISRLMEANLPISRMVLMMQDEAKERFTCKIGSKSYGPLTVFSQYLYNIDIVMKLSPNSYYPAPEVCSCVLKFERKAKALPPNFVKVVKASFAMRRKTLYNNMLSILSKDEANVVIESAGLSPSIRAEAVEIAAFVRLAEAFSDSKSHLL